MTRIRAAELARALADSTKDAFFTLIHNPKGTFDLEADGGADQSSVAKTTEAFRLGMESGLHITVPAGRWPLDHTLLPEGQLILDAAASGVDGVSAGASVIEVWNPLAGGHIIRAGSTGGKIADLSIDLGAHAPNSSTTNASASYTLGAGLPSTITLTSGTFGKAPVPGGVNPQGGTYPAKMYAALEADESHGIPAAHFSYTGVDTNLKQLTGVVIDPYSSEIFEDAATVLGLTSGVYFTWPSGATVTWRPAWGSAIVLTGQRQKQGGVTTAAVTLPGETICKLTAATTVKNDGSSFTVTVNDTTGLKNIGAFPATGKLLVGGYRCSYSAKTATTFTCTWDADNRDGSDHALDGTQTALLVVDVPLSAVTNLDTPSPGRGASSSTGICALGAVDVWYDEIVGTTLKGVWGGDYPGQPVAAGTQSWSHNNAYGQRVRDITGIQGCDGITLHNAWTSKVEGFLNQNQGRFGLWLRDNPAHPDLGENTFQGRTQGKTHIYGCRMGDSGGWRIYSWKSNSPTIGLQISAESMDRGGTTNCFVVNSGWESPGLFGGRFGGGAEIQQQISLENTKILCETGTVAAWLIDRRAQNVVFGEGCQSVAQKVTDANGNSEVRGYGLYIRDGGVVKVNGVYDGFAIGLGIEAPATTNLHVEVADSTMFTGCPTHIWDKSSIGDQVEHAHRVNVAVSSYTDTVNYANIAVVELSNNRSCEVKVNIHGTANAVSCARSASYILTKAGSGVQPVVAATIADNDVGAQLLGASLRWDFSTRAPTDFVTFGVAGDWYAAGGRKVTSATAAFTIADEGRKLSITIGGTTYDRVIVKQISATEILVDRWLPAGSALTGSIGVGDCALQIRSPAGSSTLRCQVRSIAGQTRRMSVPTRGGSNAVGAKA